MRPAGLSRGLVAGWLTPLLRSISQCWKLGGIAETYQHRGSGTSGTIYYSFVLCYSLRFLNTLLPRRALLVLQTLFVIFSVRRNSALTDCTTGRHQWRECDTSQIERAEGTSLRLQLVGSLTMSCTSSSSTSTSIGNTVLQSV